MQRKSEDGEGRDRKAKDKMNLKTREQRPRKWRRKVRKWVECKKRRKKKKEKRGRRIHKGERMNVRREEEDAVNDK